MDDNVSISLTQRRWRLLERVLARAIDAIDREDHDASYYENYWGKLQPHRIELCRIRYEISQASGQAIGLTESVQLLASPNELENGEGHE